MLGRVIIRAEELGKKYLIGHVAERERYTALRDVVARGARRVWRKALDGVRGRTLFAADRVEEFWALKDVSFEVKRGEVLGIIGRNGAGKSTLLKILSRITEPSEGRVTIEGRVASLLEVGTGFHPELTGRENVFLNGAILGMSRAEIRRKFDEIVAFAEVEKFLDTPVKRYSSGMYVRLAFAVAAHLEPEILVVDEVLAVGDAEFQKKCLGKMSEVAGGGRTVLFVSHNLGTVAALCENALLLAGGTVSRIGPARQVIGEYTRQARTRQAHAAALGPQRGPLALTAASIHDRLGDPTEWFDSDQDILVTITYALREPVSSYRVGITVAHAEFGTIFSSINTDSMGRSAGTLGEHSLTCTIPRNLLAPGEYTVSIGADIPMVAVLAEAGHALAFCVTSAGAAGGEIPDGRRGLVRPRLKWQSRDHAALAFGQTPAEQSPT
jgi:lipopolysaccharide transport system ATP-binding protein